MLLPRVVPRDGICTNLAESYFARLRRMIGGQHHHVSPQYLHQYASEAAWKEDHRRLDNGALTSRAISLAMAHRRSKNWCGYWQRAAPLQRGAPGFRRRSLRHERRLKIFWPLTVEIQTSSLWTSRLAP